MERNDHTPEDKRRDEWLDTEIGSSTRSPEPPRVERPARPSFLGRMFPGFVGGVIGALVTGAVAFPFLDQPVSNVNDTAVTSEGTPLQTSSNVGDTSVTDAVAAAQPAVVTVNNFATQGFSSQSVEAGVGSGVIYKKEGDAAYIVTNHHVVNGADRLTVTFNDGKTADATLMGSDATYDLAVLKVDAADVPAVINIGKSGELKPGQTVIAIGNPLGQFENSVTRGVVSSTSRLVPVDTDENGQADFNAEVIQTDAAINPGNSGGALINEAGQLIGINSMKIATDAVEGVGFSIPIDIALPLINQIEQTGEVNHPSLGVSLRDVSEFPPGYLTEQINLPESVTNGTIIIDVQANSSAARAGLQARDVIVKINDQDVSSFIDLRSELVRDTDGTVSIEYIRDGQTETVDVEIQNANGSAL
ncbi:MULTISPECIES: S1C family serine protease [Exiguobacterium]|uniref:Trypsin-like peptidase domain-containing protein n=1 Tax=Exiguobacterium alkaliphilum TaxID=1428684 RepID=A0ABT2KY36_9BACL|nr:MULTISPECIES: trypsin-like peptidase domain-containing protein [Exiguobacterium]MCT4795206.1 trypsin-like peptidase domain-containing protein [Exiguobacterium alkaliphilum]QUE85502.1 trypsin-like peptidase domain-containing protein [Exiguobacterium alkaliphilum]